MRRRRCPPRGGRKFLRFAVARIDSGSCQQLGVFQAAYQLRRSSRRNEGVREPLGPVLQWFGENLKAPHHVPTNAIFWFRSDADACVRRIWEIIHVLKAHGVLVWMTQCDYPGRVAYHDRFQVAAVPDAARAWRRRQV
jgi:hypothetical protein